MSISNVRRSTASAGRSTASFARKHSRVSLAAAGAATVGVVAAATASAGVVPWSQAIGNVAKTVQADGSLSAGHSTASAFDAASILKAATYNHTSVAPPGAAASVNGRGTQLTALHAAATGGSSAPGATSGTPHAFLALPAILPLDATHQATKPAAKQTTAKQTTAKQTTAKPVVTAKPVAAKPVAAKPVAAKPVVKPKPVAAKPAAAKPAPAPSQPFLFYDSVTPSALPAGQIAAVYANGSYAASPSQVGGHRAVLWIDTNGSDTYANVLDVEPGDATPAGAAQWVDTKLTRQPHAVAIVYTMISDWGQVKADIAGLPAWMQSRVQYWIADPTGYPHIVPGSSATQWYWGTSTDESSALGTFGH